VFNAGAHASRPLRNRCLERATVRGGSAHQDAPIDFLPCRFHITKFTVQVNTAWRRAPSIEK